MRELSPGVYIGRRVRIAPSAKLNPPCWLGEHAWVGPGAVVGPDTVLEDHVYVDQSAGIIHSVIGPRTYVGVLTEVRNSLAWGRNLLNLKTGSHTEVSDHFLLGELGLSTRSGTSRPPGRLAALLALIFTSPLLLVAWWRNRRSSQPLFVLQRRHPVALQFLRRGPGQAQGMAHSVARVLRCLWLPARLSSAPSFEP